jgi:hypothetical protein
MSDNQEIHEGSVWRHADGAPLVTDEMVEAALEAWWSYKGFSDYKPDMRAALEAALAVAPEINSLLKAPRIDRPDRPADEPVAWAYVNTDGECEQIEWGDPPDDPAITALYIHPPRKRLAGDP